MLKLSWHTLSRASRQYEGAHSPCEVIKQRGMRVKGLNCELRRDRICARRPASSGDPQFGWSYGGGNLGLIRLHGYLVQRLVLHCAG